MPSILDVPLPQAPQALEGLSDAQIAAAFLANPPLWIEAFKDTNTHLNDVHLYAVHLQDQVDTANVLLERSPDCLLSPERSEPPTGIDTNPERTTQVWVNMFTVSINAGMAIGPISSIIVMPDGGRKPFTVISPFNLQLEHNILTKEVVRGKVSDGDVTITRKNTEDKKPLADFIVFGDQGM